MARNKVAVNQELVVLVDEEDREVGVMLKSKVHTQRTPLHRGFSVFVFNGAHEVLVQQRAKSKRTWPGVWSNSCCGHPAPGESYVAAVRRRVRYELGIGLLNLEHVANYRYRFERKGVVENEICPIYQAKARGRVQVNPAEVADWRWVAWKDWLEELRNDSEQRWSEWCKEEVGLVSRYFRGVDHSLRV